MASESTNGSKHKLNLCYDYEGVHGRFSPVKDGVTLELLNHNARARLLLLSLTKAVLMHSLYESVHSFFVLSLCYSCYAALATARKTLGLHTKKSSFGKCC